MQIRGEALFERRESRGASIETASDTKKPTVGSVASTKRSCEN